MGSAGVGVVKGFKGFTGHWPTNEAGVQHLVTLVMYL